MAIDTSQWETDEQGDIVLHTVTAYQCIPIQPHDLGLRIEYVTSQAQMDARRNDPRAASALQVRLSLAQANQIAVALRKIADAIDQVIGPGKPRH